MKAYSNTLRQCAQSHLSMPCTGGWPTSTDARQAYDTLFKQLPQDIGHLSIQVGPLLSEELSPSEAALRYEMMMREWHLLHTPSCASIVCFALDFLEIDLAPDMLQALLSASLIGSIDNGLSYHNAAHFSKVLLQVLRLTSAHNRLFEKSNNMLSHDEIALLMIAACIHDIGHDGKGNTLQGKHTTGRLEQQSVDIFLPYMNACGFDEESDECVLLRALVLSTDVSPPGSETCPAMQAKAAYHYHFIQESASPLRLNLDDSLVLLEKDRKAALMAVLLHEADLATSAGVSYDVTAFESICIHDEAGLAPARPHNIVNFIQKICQRKFLSDAGQKLFAANLARIYAKAETDAYEGDEILGSLSKNSFLTGLDDTKDQPIA